ncbi:SDR family NAD(P)-dependent oxidoreductase [Ponticoccus litoralis]|uniref:SDR family NAD(P)-dependent oxidoreductase n=1 Tax=Ponticoccus litoralis TaxID=422297 RepID=A0AAW9SMW3_9RHOB
MMSGQAETGARAAPFLSGRRVMVTGGSSGIGRSIAKAYAQAGADVVATGVAEADIAAARDWAETEGLSSRLSFRQLDVRNEAEVADVVGGTPDLYALVCCAGVIRRGAELDPGVFAQVVDINLNGAMRCAHAARPALAGTGGSIVMTASMLSFFGGGLVPGYSASKGGVAQLTKSLAIAWAPDGIRVNAIAPGWIRTPLTSGLQEDAGRAAAIVSRTPMARWGEPGDLAGPTLFLTTPLAGFMTGTVIPVDGGYAVA